MEAPLRRLEVALRSLTIHTFHDHRVAQGQPIVLPAYRVQPQVAMASVLRILGGGMAIKERLSRGTACAGYAGMKISLLFSLNYVLTILR